MSGTSPLPRSTRTKLDRMFKDELDDSSLFSDCGKHRRLV
jgi:hypothetical protein